MKLLINTASTFKGGGVQNALSFIEECKNISDNEYHVIIGPSLKLYIDKSDFPENFIFYEINFRPATRIFALNNYSKIFSKLEKEIKPDIVITTSGPSYWKPNTPHLAGYNLPHYIYPDSPFFEIISFPKRFKWKIKGLFIKYFFIRDSDAYVVQTDDVNERLKNWLDVNKPIYTVSNTCSNYFFKPVSYPEKLSGKFNKEFRLLLISAYYHHKNFEIIPKIIERFSNTDKKSIRFVLTLEKDIYKSIIPLRHREFVYNVGPVRIEEAPSLYQECDAIFLPTLLECFSASYPEAMAVKKPVITTDIGFSRSICDEAALFFKPNDEIDALKKIRELLQSENLRNSLIMKGIERLKLFPTPQERAKRYLEICENLLIDNNKNNK